MSKYVTQMAKSGESVSYVVKDAGARELIAAETAAREAAVSAEASAREAADTAEASARAAAVSEEASAREAADADLNNALNGNDTAFGETDFSNITTLITPPSAQNVRLSKIATAIGGKIKKLYFKSAISTNIRFWLGELVDSSHIKLVKTFVVLADESKTEYINGEDFSLDFEVSPKSVIGFNIPAGANIGYFGGTNGSYQIVESGYDEGGTYPAFTNTYGVGIGAELESKIGQLNREVKENSEQIEALISDTSFGETDFTNITNPISPPSTTMARFSKIETEAGGKIKKLYFKSALSTNIRFWIGELVDSSHIKLAKTFVVLADTTKTEYTNGVDFDLDFEAGPKSVIGFNTPAGANIGYYGGTNGSYQIVESGYDEGGTYPALTNTYGVGIGAVLEGKLATLRNDIDKNSDAIEELNEQIQNLIAADVIRYGKKIPSSTSVYVDSDIIHARVKYTASSDSEVKLNRAINNGVAVCRTDFVNFGTGKIGFYSAHAYDATPEVYKEFSPGFSFVIGHEYDIFSTRYLGFIYQITITDAWTQETYTATELDGVSTIGSGWGIRTVTAGAGVTVVDSDNYMLQPQKNRVCFIGDSYIEGNSIADIKEKRYAALAFERLKGDCFIWGMGGASSSDGISWMTSIMNLSESDYYVLALGMNDSDYSTWKTNMDAMIAAVVNAGKTPVLVTIPPVTSTYANEAHMQMNAYIRSLQHEYIDVAKLLSSGHDGTTFDSSYFLGDGVHPTVASHQLIYDLIVSTIPELFGTAIVNY